MSEATGNLEQLIEKLKKDGVDAGRAEGEKAKDVATKEAEKIIADARAEAKMIIADAEEQAKQKIIQSKAELTLAVRDAMLSLRQGISKTVSVIVKDECSNILKDTSFLAGLIKDVVNQYVQADLQGKNSTVAVSDEALQPLCNLILSELSSRSGVRLVAGLKENGFNFATVAGTVEITESAIAEVLAKLVNNELQEMLLNGNN